jgi:hypothetical protein
MRKEVEAYKHVAELGEAVRRPTSVLFADLAGSTFAPLDSGGIIQLTGEGRAAPSDCAWREACTRSSKANCKSHGIRGRSAVSALRVGVDQLSQEAAADGPQILRRGSSSHANAPSGWLANSYRRCRRSGPL